MLRLGTEKISEMMQNSERLRNIALIGSEGHGKRTIREELINRAGIIPIVDDRRYYDRIDDYEREIDYYQDPLDRSNTAQTLFYKSAIEDSSEQKTEREYLINLITLTASDQSSEMAASLRITDGAILIIDAAKEFSSSFQVLMRQSIQQRVKPVLMINKIDVAILDNKSDAESLFQYFTKIIDRSNQIMETYSPLNQGQIAIDPVENVLFGSAKGGWGFTISTFAHLYAKKFCININTMKAKLWGDNFFDNRKKQWHSVPKSDDDRPLKRSFVEFIMEPICKFCESLFRGQEEQYLRTMHILNIQLSEKEKTAKGRDLVGLVMKKWLPLVKCVLQMIIINLPSPVVAQKYRTKYLYEGPQNDLIAQGMRTCDSKAPLMIFISKMVPSRRSRGRFYAFGRIFSGSIQPGKKIKIMGPNYKFGKNDDLFQKCAQRILLLQGRQFTSVGYIPCGNLIAISGIDNYITRFGSLTDCNIPNSYPMRTIREKTAPIMKMVIAPKIMADLPKLIEGISKLKKLNGEVVYECDDNGEQTILGSSQQKLNNYCRYLQNDFANCQIVKSQPRVIYKEAMTAAADKKLKVISQNKHNRLIGTGGPLAEDFIHQIDNQIHDGKQGNQLIQASKTILQEYGWDQQATKKIWCFGPNQYGPNIVVNSIPQQVKNSKEIKESVSSAFQWTSKMGVLCQEEMRGMKFDLLDCELHSDAIHRGGGQIMPTTRRLLYGIQLLCRPTLFEPIYQFNISVSQEWLGSVYQFLNERQGIITEEKKYLRSEEQAKEGAFSYCQLTAFVSVKQSIGLPSLLRENTNGDVLLKYNYDHMKPIQGLPFIDPQATELVMSIRKRKGLKEEIPIVETYAEIIN